MNIILASNSPRRNELLSKLNLNHKVIPSSFNEECNLDLNEEDKAIYIAKHKALDILDKYPNSLVIGADTTVIFEGLTFGKPTTKGDAIKMLSLLQNNTHKVITGVCLITKDKEISFSDTTYVTFNKMTKDEILDYISKENVYDKAGSYAIQGYASIFIKEIKGSYTNVVGLPLSKVYNALKEFK